MRCSSILRFPAILLGILAIGAIPRNAHAADEWNYYADLRLTRDVLHDGDALWISTASGIVRFDKTSLNIGRPRYEFFSPFNGPAANRTIAGTVDSRGQKWFAHDEVDAGLSVVDTLGNWSIIRPRDGLLLRAGRKANTVFATGDSVWAGTESGLTLFVGGRVVLRLDVDDGLPSSNVRAFARSGPYVWVGTEAGLARLLGGVVTNYRVPQGLVSNDIYSLATRGDELWVGTVNGISIVRASGDTIQTWPSTGILPPPGEVRPEGETRVATVFDIAFEDTIPWVATKFGPARFEGAQWQRYIDLRNNDDDLFKMETRGIAALGIDIWIGNSVSGAAKFDVSSARPGWRAIAFPTIPTNFLGSLDLDASGDVWLTGQSKRDPAVAGGQSALKFNGNIFSPFRNGFTSILHDVVRVDAQDRKWFGFWDIAGLRNDGVTGINVLSASETSIDTLNIDELCEADANRRQACTDIDFAPDGIHAWAAFDRFGVVCLRSDRDSCMSWISSDGISPGEPDGATANSIALDRRGGVWIGFFKNAAVRLDPGALLYSRVDDVIERFNVTNNGLPDQRVNVVEVDSLGRVWFGTEGGLGILDPADTTWVVHRVGNNILDQSIRSIAFLPDGRALVGDNSGNVYTILSDLRTFGPTYNQATVGFPKARVSAIKYDVLRTTPDHHVIWLATYGGGLVQFKLDRIADPVDGPAATFRVFPNPFIVGEGSNFVTFDELRGGSTVGLYTLNGEMVRMLSTLGETGTQIEWDTLNSRGEEVASGVYFYVVRQNGGDYGHGKLAIIR
jgi:ligand-binding sensor domain-containing protein